MLRWEPLQVSLGACAALVFTLAAPGLAAQPEGPVVTELPREQDRDEDEDEVVEISAEEAAAVAAPARYVVERVEVEGNWRTGDDVVRSRVDVRAGELLDEERVAVSRLRLLATGYFRSVEVRLERGSARGRVVVVFRILERIPIPVVEGVYLGFSKVTPVFGGMALVDNNFLGRGMILGFGGVVSPRQQAFRARLVDPSILQSSVGARARLTLNNGLEPIALGSSATGGGALRYQRLGGSAGLMLTEGWVGRFAMDYRFEVLRGELRLVPGASRPPRLLPGWSRLSTLTLSFERDTRNRPFVPTSGTVLRFSAEGASAVLLSDYEYAKFRAGYEAQLPLARLWGRLEEHGLSFRLEAGYIQQGLASGGESGAPFFDEFYIGDTSYFRYQRDSLPRYFGANFAPFNEYGDLMVSVGGEYDFPLWNTGAVLHRAYLYAAWDVSEVTRTRDIVNQRLRGRLLLDHFTPTFDLGLKLETVLGTFVFSGSYLVDLVL